MRSKILTVLLIVAAISHASDAFLKTCYSGNLQINAEIGLQLKLNTSSVINIGVQVQRVVELLKILSTPHSSSRLITEKIKSCTTRYLTQCADIQFELESSLQVEMDTILSELARISSMYSCSNSMATTSISFVRDLLNKQIGTVSDLLFSMLSLMGESVGWLMFDSPLHQQINSMVQSLLERIDTTMQNYIFARLKHYANTVICSGENLTESCNVIHKEIYSIVGKLNAAIFRAGICLFDKYNEISRYGLTSVMRQIGCPI